MTSPERWEAEQMLKSGVISITDLPNFDEEAGGLNPEVEQGTSSSPLFSSHHLLHIFLIYQHRNSTSH
jgi:hypothetical protein